MDPERIVGTEIAGYAIESVLGRGAMGVVYVARQRSPERRVALKLITPAFAGDEVFRRRFLREAAAAAAIEHPHILPVYAAGEADGVLYLVTRLIDGRDLRDILRTEDRLSLERAVDVVAQVGGALDAAHDRGLVHRDVKPGNILVTRPADAEDPDFCYLTDFGVSTWTASPAATMSSTGQMVGTANYVSPEQIEGRPVDGGTDLYSLGCVLYECLAGYPPFSGRAPAAILYAHLHEAPSPPSAARSDLPGAVDAVVARALAKPVEDRYSSARALAQDLRAAAAGVPVAAPKVPLARASHPTGVAARPPRRRPSRRVVVAAVVTLVAVVAAIGTGIAVLGGDGSPGSSSSPPPVPRLVRQGVQATATSTAASSHDASGNLVTYQPANVIDGKIDTAWRTAGNGRGESVTLVFDNPVEITRIGLIPGYAKTDPLTGVNRFLQDRVIEEVAYVIPGIPPTRQTFAPDPVPQTIELHVTTSRVTIRILETTAPGDADYTAISEVYVYGFEQ